MNSYILPCQLLTHFFFTEWEIIRDSLNEACGKKDPRKIYLREAQAAVDGAELSSRDLDTMSSYYNIDPLEIVSSSVIQRVPLKIPLVDFNVPEAVKVIDNAIEIPAENVRDKPLVATTRGSGSGKSRAIEELRLHYLLNSSDTLAIAVTFNSKWDFDSTELQPFIEMFTNTKLSIAMSIVARMLSMLYEDLDLEDARVLIITVITSIINDKWKEFTLVDKQSKFAANLLVGAIVHVKEAVERKSSKKIKKFVLFIDESSRVNDAINKKNSESSKDPKMNNDSIYSGVRRAVLGEEIESVVKCALVMTSLEAESLAVTDSSRDVKPIDLASQLNVTEIVDKIWLQNLNKIEGFRVDKPTYRSLLLLAASVNTIPRLVEFVNDILVHQVKNGKNFDYETFSQLFKELFGRVKSKYRDAPFPNGKYLRALLLGTGILIDPDVVKLIRRSVYVNQVSNYVDDSDVTIIPQGNLFFLNASITIQENAITRNLISLSNLVSDCVKNKNEGDTFEKVFLKWTQVKLLATSLGGNKSSLRELLFQNIDKEFQTKDQMMSRINLSSLTIDVASFVDFECSETHSIELRALLNAEFSSDNFAIANVRSSVSDIA